MKQGKKQGKKAKTGPLRVMIGHLSSQEFGVGTNISKNTKAELYSELTL